MNFTKTPRLDVFKSTIVKGAQFSANYEFPVLQKSEAYPTRAVPFDKANKQTDHDQWLHFYIHDRCFECVWRTPERYLPLFKRFKGVVTPDYSLYRELPLAMQIWNTYRNRAIAYWLQSNGIPIIPNVCWGDERTYSFAFEGIPKHSTIAVSTNGCIRSKLDRFYFRKGLAHLITSLEPTIIVNYSQTPDDIFDEWRHKGLPIICIENYQATVRKAVI